MTNEGKTTEETIETATRDELLALAAEHVGTLDDETLRALTHLVEGLANDRRVFGHLNVEDDDRNQRQKAPPFLRNAISLLGRRLVKSG